MEIPSSVSCAPLRSASPPLPRTRHRQPFCRALTPLRWRGASYLKTTPACVGQPSAVSTGTVQTGTIWSCRRRTLRSRQPRRVELLAFPAAQLLDIAGPLQVFASANERLAARGLPPPYAMRVVAPTGRIAATAGLTFAAEPLPPSACAVDTLVVAGGRGVMEVVGDAALIGWVRERAAGARRVASVAGMSERSFSCRYQESTGLTPARAVERLRVEAARQLLCETQLPIKRIASCCGLGSEETMRRSFLRVQGVGPARYRARFSLGRD